MLGFKKDKEKQDAPKKLSKLFINNMNPKVIKNGSTSPGVVVSTPFDKMGCSRKKVGTRDVRSRLVALQSRLLKLIH